jgi:hypothetical protein
MGRPTSADLLEMHRNSAFPIAYRLVRRGNAEHILQGRFVFSDVTDPDRICTDWQDLETIDEPEEEPAGERVTDLLFNVNDYAYVKLTPVGQRILSSKSVSFTKDGEGWSKWQLWELMSIFGGHLRNGCDVPFETTIRLVST